MIRLFIAIKINNKQKLMPYFKGLDFEQAKVVAIDNLHITLKFLGYTDENLLPEIETVLGRIAKKHRPFDLKFDRLGAFPSKKKARVFWIGESDNKEAELLASDMDEAFERLGFKREKRKFKVHLTISRFKKPTEASNLVDRQIEPIEQNINSFILFESKLASKGARYKALNKYFLKSA